MKIQRRTFFIFCIVLLSKLHSQISINTPSVNVCAPANITFIAPPGATSVSWTFGPYAPSTATSGGFNVLTPGTFTATFSGMVGSTNITFAVPVVVNQPPVASFTMQQPSQDCAVKTVTFINQSTGTSPIANYIWVYGDGNLQNLTSGANHTYGYTIVGNYTVTLQITDVNGCGSQSSLGTINVIPSPTAVISSNPPVLVGCQSNFSANFSAAGSQGSNLTYTWNFGNGQTSNQVSSTQNFTSQPSQYLVTLSVTSGGCTHSTFSMVTVAPATINAVVPGTVCLGTPFTSTVTSNQPLSIWNLGNNTSNMVTTPVSSPNTVNIPGYSIPGIYTITINAGTAPCFAAPLTRTVLVEQVTADFTSLGNVVSCASPFIISYTNTSSSNATNFMWTCTVPGPPLVTMGPPIATFTASGSSPSFTINHGSTNQYAVYVRPFSPTITLIASTQAGCSGFVSKILHSIERPAAWFNTDKKEGCAPLTVTFMDSSIVFPSCPIISYTWCNGAVPPVFVSGALSLPPGSPNRIPWQTFTYANTGTYSPYLVIETANNYTDVVNTCIDMSFIGEIIVVNPPVLSFNVPPGPFCPNDVVQITNTSPSINDVQHWHVDSDEGFFSGCVSDPNPGWKFTTVGTHDFTLTGYQNSCASSVVGGPVTINGPIVKARYETNCDFNRDSVNFEIDLSAVASATLDFGDGSNQVFLGTPSSSVPVNIQVPHIYAGSGDYLVTLTGVNPITSCPPSVFTMTVNVRNISAGGSGPSESCKGNSVTFLANSSIDVLSGCGRGYLWFIDNVPPVESSAPTVAHTFTAAGNHQVILMVKDINNCISRDTMQIRVSEAIPAFAFSSNTICLSTGTVELTNNTPQLPDAITSFTWNFGDGNTLITSSPAPFIHTYTASNIPSTTYMVNLQAVNALGCVGSTQMPLVVFLPQVAFQASNPNFCVPLGGATSISFTPLAPYTTYTIDFGVLPASTLITSGISAFSYSAPGVYTIQTRVENVAGCQNAGVFTINAVQTPTADFAFSSPNSTGGNNICSGKVVTFTNTSLPDQYTPTWNLGSGVISNNSNTVSLAYSSPVTSTVVISLTVNTGPPAYCTAASVRNFTIYAFDGDFVMSDTVVCLKSGITFSLSPSSHGLGAWLWSFGDATSSDTLLVGSGMTSSVVSHPYNIFPSNPTGTVNASLIYWSGDFACKDAVEKQIRVIRIIPDFDRNLEQIHTDTAHCINIIDQFTNRSSTNSSVLSYTWNFGNGFSGNGKDMSYFYPKPGIYPVKLLVENEKKCVDSLTKNMIIYALPTATIFPDTSGYCPDQPFDLHMKGSPGVKSGTFTPASAFNGDNSFVTDDASFTSRGLASVSTIYTLVVTNTNNCVSEPIDTAVTIVQPPKPVAWDTSVVIGQKVPISVNLEKNVTYTWTPVTADLNCTECLNPVSSSTVDIVYTLVLEDKLRCKQVFSTYNIRILPKSSVDVPTAFTPNGDGKNDVIFADGWGIKHLNYFRIFNRWGQLIFETDDLNTGWDGTYMGLPQNMDTYVYQVSVETYIDDEPILKSSTFKLIR